MAEQADTAEKLESRLETLLLQKEIGNLDLATMKSEIDYLFATLARVEAGTNTITKPVLFYLKGKLYRLANNRNQAEESLTKALKLQPKCYQAYEELAELQFEQNGFVAASGFLSKALEIVPTLSGEESKQANKRLLRKQSMVKRRLPTTNDMERAQNVRDSVNTAKLALTTDVMDGDSWYIYGNSLMHWFLLTNEINHLNQSLTAYTKAGELKTSELYAADLIYNKSTVLRYLLKYQDALSGFTSVAPELSYAKDQIDQIATTLAKVSQALKAPAEKSKKVTALWAKVDHFRAKKDPATTEVFVTDLSTPANDKASSELHLVPVSFVSDAKSTPVIFVGMDPKGSLVAVSSYQIPHDKLNYGVCVTIKKPHITHINVSSIRASESKVSDVEFDCIVVTEASDIAINGHWVSSMDSFTQAQLLINSR